MRYTILIMPYHTILRRGFTQGPVVSETRCDRTVHVEEGVIRASS